MYLVDTSVWIRHFSSQDTFSLAQFCEPRERTLCLPVYQEILQGIRDQGHFRKVKQILDSASMVESPLEKGVFLEAAELYRGARRQGITIRSSHDCVIAACALRHNLVVVHSDRDYRNLAKISALREIDPWNGS